MHYKNYEPDHSFKLCDPQNTSTPVKKPGRKKGGGDRDYNEG